MRKISKALAGTATTGAALVAALALAAAPAFASVNSVVISGSTNADGHFTAVASGPTLTDDDTGITLNCDSATAHGFAPNGTYTDGAPDAIPVASLDALTWDTCDISGLPFSVTANDTPWYLNATGPTVGGVTPGSITGVNATLSGLCNATVKGTVTGSYDNSDHTLTIDGGDLTVSGVGGLCLGLINNDDSVTYVAHYVVTPALQVNAS